MTLRRLQLTKTRFLARPKSVDIKMYIVSRAESRPRATQAHRPNLLDLCGNPFSLRRRVESPYTTQRRYLIVEKIVFGLVANTRNVYPNLFP